MPKQLWATLGLLVTLALPVGAQSQRLAVPSYFLPGPLWGKVGAAAPVAGLAIINPNSGPGDAIDAAYRLQVRVTQARGLRVLCYVHTGYAKRDIREVQEEVRRAFRWYGVDGIFFDEVSSGKDALPYYRQCRDFARAQRPKALVVLNPGTQVDEGYMGACDIVCNFESDYRAYRKDYAAPGWIARYPAGRFWHIVLGVSTDAEMREVVRLSKKRHAGWVFVTSYSDANQGNPYDRLPGEPYWSDEIAALKSR